VSFDDSKFVVQIIATGGIVTGTTVAIKGIIITTVIIIVGVGIITTTCTAGVERTVAKDITERSHAFAVQASQRHRRTLSKKQRSYHGSANMRVVPLGLEST